MLSHRGRKAITATDQRPFEKNINGQYDKEMITVALFGSWIVRLPTLIRINSLIVIDRSTIESLQDVMQFFLLWHRFRNWSSMETGHVFMPSSPSAWE